MDGIKSRHGLGNESAPWGNEVTGSINSGLERTRLLRESVDQSLSMGTKSFTQSGNRRQELEQAWTTTTFTCATEPSTPTETLFPLPPVQGPEWANWAVIPSFQGVSSSPGDMNFVFGFRGMADYRYAWGAYVFWEDAGVPLGAVSHPDGALIPVVQGHLDLGWWVSAIGSTADSSRAVTITAVINWIR